MVTRPQPVSSDAVAKSGSGQGCSRWAARRTRAKIVAMTQDSTTSNPAGSVPPGGRYDIRNLRRSRDDRMIGGVCGGLGRYLGIDPIILRIVLAALAIFGGIGLLLYALAWLFVAEEGSDASEAQRLFRGRATPLTTVAAFVVGALGVLALTDIAYHGDRSRAVVLILLAVIVIIAINRRHNQRLAAPYTGPNPYAPPYAPPYSPPPAAPSAPTGGPTATPYAAPTAPASSTAMPYAPPVPGNYAPLGPPAGFAPSRPLDTAVVPEPGRAPKPPRPPRQPSVLGPLALSAGVVVVGVLFALNASHALDISAQTILATALLTIGIALVIGAWIGRARGIIAVGVVLTVSLAIAAAVDVPLRGGIGSRFVNPTQVDQLPSAYHLGIGQQTIDLSGLTVGGGKASVTANVGIGRLRVDVPDNTKIVVRARAGTGDVRLFGDECGGTDVARHLVWAPNGAATSGEIDLDLRTGIGRVDVNLVAAGGAGSTTRPSLSRPSPPVEPPPVIRGIAS
jgi:phage shock protein PspC (stress-responsive transcriptional regulator)